MINYIILLLLLSCSFLNRSSFAEQTNTKTEQPKKDDKKQQDPNKDEKVKKAKEAQDEIKKLQKTIEHTMSIVRAKEQDQTDDLKNMLTDTALEIFDTYKDAEAWIVVIGLESKFNTKARSSTGAVGLGQLIPRYAASFGIPCGIEATAYQATKDPRTNARLSACYFKSLLDEFDGSIPLALVAYNQGSQSVSVKNIQNLKSINTEASNYVTRFFVLADKLTKGVTQ